MNISNYIPVFFSQPEKAEGQEKDELFLLQRTILQPQKEEEEEPDLSKAMKIARKIARGEGVSLKEMTYLQKYFPILLQEAELAKMEGERVKAELENAKFKAEQQDILTRENLHVMQLSEVNQGYADLVAEAVEKACEEAKGAFEQPQMMDEPGDEDFYTFSYHMTDRKKESRHFDQKS